MFRSRPSVSLAASSIKRATAATTLGRKASFGHGIDLFPKVSRWLWRVPLVGPALPVPALPSLYKQGEYLSRGELRAEPSGERPLVV